jgi:type I restriction enzyme S subunit
MSKEPTRFKQTEIGELPEEWEVVKLGDVAVLEMEQIPVSTLPENTLYVGMEHIESNTGRLLTDELPTVRGIKGLVFQFTPEHILYGKLRPYLNKVWKPDFSGVCSTELVPIRCNKNQINSDYLKFWLLSPMFVAYAKKFSEGTRMPRVNLKALINAPIPLPPLEEQKRIAGVLRLVDRVAEETRRIVDIYERAKRFALKRLLTRGIGHTRFKQTEIGELPEGWEVKKLGEIATIKQGGRLGLTKKDYVPEGYPAFSATGQDGYVSVYEYEGEAIILSSIGAQCGKCFYATGKWTTLANTQIIFVNPEIANTLFIFYQVNRPNFWMRLGSAQPFIRPSDVKNAKVIIPPLEEQKQIVEMLSTIDAAIENERRYLGVLEKCKRWLLDNLLTGKIRLSPEVDEILKGVLPDAF